LQTFEICHGRSSLPIVLSCEHASGEIPDEFGDLGMTEEHLTECARGKDQGAADLFDYLVRELDCLGVRNGVSRLVIDANRYEDQDELIPTRWGGKEIPGNIGLSDDERTRRIELYCRPYHQALVDSLLACEQLHGKVFFFAIHAMAEQFEGQVREMDFALIANRGRELAPFLEERLRTSGYTAAINQPYHLERDILRVPVGSELERFNETAVLIEMNERCREDDRAKEALLEAIRGTVEENYP
jgi:predicted N-formylglutamate amidohydrolase